MDFFTASWEILQSTINYQKKYLNAEPRLSGASGTELKIENHIVFLFFKFCKAEL